MARRAFILFLVQQRYDCEEADEGASALAKLESGQALNLIISDNQMPVMTGMVLLINLKTHSRLYAISVILYSGNFTDEIRKQARQVGAFGVFNKS